MTISQIRVTINEKQHDDLAMTSFVNDKKAKIDLTIWDEKRKRK